MSEALVMRGTMRPGVYAGAWDPDVEVLVEGPLSGGYQRQKPYECGGEGGAFDDEIRAGLAEAKAVEVLDYYCGHLDEIDSPQMAEAVAEMRGTWKGIPADVRRCSYTVREGKCCALCGARGKWDGGRRARAGGRFVAWYRCVNPGCDGGWRVTFRPVRGRPGRYVEESVTRTRRKRGRPRCEKNQKALAADER